MSVWGLPHCHPPCASLSGRLRDTWVPQILVPTATQALPVGSPTASWVRNQTGVPAPRLSLTRPKSGCRASPRPSQAGALPPRAAPGCGCRTGVLCPCCWRPRPHPALAHARPTHTGLVPAEQLTSPGPAGQSLCCFCQFFFFFFYLIKSHPPRIISPDFLVFTRLTRAITL